MVYALCVYFLDMVGRKKFSRAQKFMLILEYVLWRVIPGDLDFLVLFILGINLVNHRESVISIWSMDTNRISKEKFLSIHWYSIIMYYTVAFIGLLSLDSIFFTDESNSALKSFLQHVIMRGAWSKLNFRIRKIKSKWRINYIII